MIEEYIQAEETGLEVAVIGMAGRFPGAKDIDKFWQNLRNGVESVTFFSDEELKAVGLNSTSLEKPNFVKARGYLDGPEYFDAVFFGYTPAEATAMDPQVRFLHECTWEALEDAGCNPETYEGLIGVYFGASDNLQWRFITLWKAGTAAGPIGSQFTGSMLSNKDLLCSRLSYQLNLTGPSAAVYSACSTSLVAIHKACRELLGGECDIALAGGVSITIPQEQGYFYEEGMIESPDGHCRAFDVQANGTVFGSGVGVVVLKRLDEAVKAGNHIYAVIKGSAVNNDGKRKVGYTAPSVEGQAEVIRAAYQVADVDPDSIGYIETHGTGTTLGDPIEIKALVKGMNRTSDNNNHCPIGAVKTNVGHLDAAAGVAGFIKTVLCLKHRLIPPTIHFTSPNPELELEKKPFYINNQLKEWVRGNNRMLRAGVSSFGIGGTNAHMVLEEWPQFRGSDDQRTGTQKAQLILLSAKTASALDKMTENLAIYLKKKVINSDNSDNPVNPGFLADVAYTLQVGRKAFVHRKALVCSNIEEAIEALSNPDSPSSRVQRLVSNEEFQHTVFMFAGQGSQYVNMGLELYQEEPVFREVIDQCFEILKPLMNCDIKEVLYPSPQAACPMPSAIDQTEITQPVIFAFEYALAKLLMHWGITPDAMIGYSFGEYMAACLAGVFSLGDALALVVLRGRLMQELSTGGMLSVPLPEKDLMPLLDEGLSIAIVNEPACIVAGEVEAIERFEEKMKQHRLMCLRINANFAVHTSIMDDAVSIFSARLQQVRLHEPQIPYISGITGDWITLEDAVDHQYWIRHLRETIRFSQGIQRLLRERRSIFIEIGPGRDLLVLVNRYIDNDTPQPVINLIRASQKEVSDVSYLLGKIGRLWLYRQNIDWKKFHSGCYEKRRLVPLPTYPFEWQRYWLDLRPLSANNEDIRTKQPVRKTDITDWFYYPSWKRSNLVDYNDFVFKRPLHGVCLIFSGDCASLTLGTALANKLEQSGVDIVLVTEGSSFNREDAHHYSLDPHEAFHFDMLLEELNTEKRIPRWIVHLWNVTEVIEPVELTEEKLETARYTGFYSLLFLAQAIGNQSIEETMQILVVSNHMQEVMGEDLICPEKAVLLGPVRVIPHEYPNICCHSVDIILPPPGERQKQQLIQHLVMEMESGFGSRDEIIAYRNNQRWVQIVEPVPLKKNQEKTTTAYLKEKGVYLIIGGLGGIGLVLAEHLARQVKARLILTSRSGLNPLSEDKTRYDTITRKVQEIQGMGAEVLILAANAADQEQMAAVIRQAKEQFGPINGVIHSAGIVDYGGVVQGRRKIEKTEMSESVLAPKLRGTLILERLLKEEEMSPDFIVLCSSIASLMPLFGQVAYSAANAFLDAYAHYRSHHSPFVDGEYVSNLPGKKVLVRSINWSAWKQVGMAVEAVKRSGSDPDLDLKDMISPSEGVEAFDSFLGTRLSQVVVSPTELKMMIEQVQITQDEIQEGQSTHMHSEEDGVKKSLHPLQPLHRRPELDTLYTAPKTEIQKKLADIWQRFFGLEKVGIDDDFFDLGGDSLKAMAVAFKIQREFNVNVTLVEFFKRCTIRRLDEYISRAADDSKAYSAIFPTEKKEFYPLSPAQKRLYILQQMELKNIVYNETSIVELEKGLDIQRLEDTFRKLISRQESMRTSFLVINDEPAQRIHDSVEFEIERLEAESVDIIRDFVRPFDLSFPPLVRVGLIEIDKEKYILVLDMHHIIADGRSQEIFAQEFVGLYTGSILPLLKIQYKDYVRWLTSNHMKEVRKKQELYWLREFAGDLPGLDLPLDFNRPRVQNFEGRVIHFQMGKAETHALKQLASRENVTLFMLLLALFNVMLSKLSGQKDIVVGTLIAGREHIDLQSVIGMFANTLALRNFPESHLKFTDFLIHVKRRALEVFENQDYPYEELVEQVVKTRDTGRNPLFDVVFTFQPFQPNPTGQTTQTRETEEEPYESGIARFDMVLTAVETEIDLVFKLEYCTRLFKEESIQRFIGYYKMLVSSLIVEPSRKISTVEIINEEERKHILFNFNDTDEYYPRNKTISQLFTEQVHKTPDRIAVISKTGCIGARGSVPLTMDHVCISYKELNEKSNLLAGFLRGKGVTSDTIVGIMMERSFEMVIAIMGILKTGGGYMPIDVGYPQDRIDYMLNDSAAKVLVITSTLAGDIRKLRNWEVEKVFMEEVLEAPENSSQPLNLSILQLLSPSNLAYIIYTSGSTGHPKGTMINQSSLMNQCTWHSRYYNITEADHCTQFAGFGFDASVFEIFPSLTIGAALHIISDDIKSDISALDEYYNKNNITITFLPTQFYQHFMEQPTGTTSLRTVITGGEKLSRFIKRSYDLYNNYGPTENTVVTTACLVERGYGNIPIGKPIQNNQVYILEKNGFHLQPIGVPGELCITGRSLARGYLNQPELTAEKFIDLSEQPSLFPTPHSTIYRTGDLARWLQNGNIQFLGRIDRQVKVRGFRIELGEIEAQLLKRPEIKEAVVSDHEIQGGEKYLCAYITLADKKEFTGKSQMKSVLTTYLSQSLPGYMVPSFFTEVDHIPITPSGKIDKKNLPLPEIEIGKNLIPPRDKIEKELAKIWSELLSLSEEFNISIDIDTNFFELGGHSLKATIMAAKIHKTFNIKIPLVEIFKTSTIRELAAYIKNAEINIYESIQPTEMKEYYPQSSAQKRLFFLDKFENIGTSYNIPMILEFNEKPDLETYRQIFNTMIAHHETLRTSFHLINNEPIQWVHKAENVSLKIEYYESGAQGAERINVETVIQNFLRPFDLAKPPLLRLGILETAPPDQRYLVLFDIHHIVGDGTSMGVLTGEFIRLYEGRSLSPMRIQYRDFTTWQVDLFKSGKIKEQETYWMNQYPEPEQIQRLNLPTDYPRLDILSFAGDNYNFTLGYEETTSIKKMMNRYDTTLYIHMMTVFNILLYKYSAQEDIIVGGGIAGRPHEDLQNLIGMFVNMLPIRNQPQPHKTFLEFLKEVRINCINAFDNQDMQFEELVDRLNLERNPSRNPMMDVSIVVQNFEGSKEQPESLMFNPYKTQSENKTSKFDLTLYVYDMEDILYFNMEYSTALFKRETMEKIADHFIEIVKQVLEDQQIRLEDITISYELTDAKTNIFKEEDSEFTF